MILGFGSEDSEKSTEIIDKNDSLGITATRCSSEKLKIKEYALTNLG
jgi:hypothetical protein